MAHRLAIFISSAIVLLSSTIHAQNFATNFDGIPEGTTAENLAIPGIRFAPNPPGTWIVVSAGESGFIKLTGGTLLQPNTSGSLDIIFGNPVTSAAFDFAQNDTTVGSTSLLVQAFRGVTPVGSMTQPSTSGGGENFVEGSVAFSSGTPFDTIKISSVPPEIFIAIDNLVTGGGTPLPAKPVILSFLASPTPIPAGSPSTLFFSTSDATSVTIDNGVGAVAARGSLTVRPTTTTTYTLTAMGPGGTITASTKVEVITQPAIIVAAFPAGLLQSPNVGGATDRFVLTNVGGGSAGVSFNVSGGSFFTIAPNAATINPGASQTFILTGTPQVPGSYEATVSVSGGGVPSGLSFRVRLLVSAPPVGSVVPTPTTNRVDTTNLSGSLSFTNSGTSTLQGILVSDVPWIVPQSGIITIPPGQTVLVTFTIDRGRRPDAAAPNGSVTGSLTLVYLEGASSGAITSRLEPFNGAPPTNSRPITVVDTAAPVVSPNSPPPLGVGEIALFIPGLLQRSGIVSDLSLVNAFSPTPLTNQVRLFYTSSGGGGSSARSAPIASLAPNLSVQFASVAKTIFARDAEAGSLQIRTQNAEKLSLGATVVATLSPRGFFTGTLPVFRSDRSAASGERLYLPGVRKDSATRSDLYLQETSGLSGSVRADFFNDQGLVVTSQTYALQPFGTLEVADAAPAAAIGATLTNVGTGRITGHILVVDSATSDGSSVTDWSRKNGTQGSEPQMVPLVESRPGGPATRTEVVIMNSGTSRATGTLAFFGTGTSRRRGTRRATGSGSSGVQLVLPAAEGRLRGSLWRREPAFVAIDASLDLITSTAIERSVTLETNQSRVFNDLGSELGVTNASGYFVFTPSSGSVAISARIVSSVSPQPGSFGTTVPAVALSAGLRAGGSRQITGLEDAAPATVVAKRPGTFRSGFGLIEAAGASLTVRVTLRYAATVPGGLANVRAVASKEYSLTPRGAIVVNDLGRALFGAGRDSIGDLHNLQLDFDVVSGAGAVVPYVISIDNGSSDQIIRLE